MMRRGFILIITALLLCACTKKSDNISLAVNALESGDIEAAREGLEKAEAEGEDGQLLERARGLVCMGEGNYEEAVECFEKSIALSSGHVTETEFDVSYYLMSAQEKAGRGADAIETCSAILGLRPKDGETWFMRGRLNIENDNYDDGLRDFNRAIDLDPGNADVYIRIFEFLESSGYDEAAMDYLARAGSIQGKLTDLQKGRLAYCRKDYESARDFLEKARKNDEDGVILYLGRTYEALGDYNFAASLYEGFLEKEPGNEEVLNQLGLCRLLLGSADKALEAFEKALEDGGGDFKESLEFNRIVALERLGDYAKAKEYVKEYVKSYPGDGTARREEEFLTQWDRLKEEP